MTESAPARLLATDRTAHGVPARGAAVSCSGRKNRPGCLPWAALAQSMRTASRGGRGGLVVVVAGGSGSGSCRVNTVPMFSQPRGMVGRLVYNTILYTILWICLQLLYKLCSTNFTVVVKKLDFVEHMFRCSYIFIFFIEWSCTYLAKNIKQS